MVLRSLAIVLLIALPAQAQPGINKNLTDPLQLLILVEQQSIAAPFPARVTLHFHNSGQAPRWFYRKARDHAREGPSLDVRLEPVEVSQSVIIMQAQGTVLESVGLPHPKLVRLNPGDDAEEKTAVRLTPAMAKSADESKPIWGRYRLSVVYRANYSNAEEIARNLAEVLWQGEVISNVMEIELKPPADRQGSAAGTVVGTDGRPLEDVLVSLTDQQERLVGQMVVESGGRFAFNDLRLGLYWLTARFPKATEDTAVFRHVELTPAEPAGTLELMMLPQEIHEAKKVLHKPVLFRITDVSGHPLDKVTLEIAWSNGPVLDNVKGQVANDGIVALELIPGRNFVTMKRRNCPKQEERIDVAEGTGMDGFKLILECARK